MLVGVGTVATNRHRRQTLTPSYPTPNLPPPQVSAEPHHANKPLEERIGLAMRVCGMSITLTSITDFVAFELGALSTSPGVRYFCHYAASGVWYWGAAVLRCCGAAALLYSPSLLPTQRPIPPFLSPLPPTAILMDYVLQITAFVACLVWDSKRVERRHPDCSCCISPLLAKSEVVVPDGTDGAAKPDSGGGGEHGEGEGGVMGKLADFILKSPMHKAAVLMAVLGLDLFLGLGKYRWITLTMCLTLTLTLTLTRT